MRKVQTLLRGNKHAVFMDFEGTQFSHEMIAIGAVMCSLDKNGRIKKYKEPFKAYVTAKNKIGSVVVKLTGITQETLDKEGISFPKALENFKRYCGLNFKKSVFVTFGNHDMKILNESISHNFNCNKEICHQIQKNYIDFSVLISEFVKDKNNNPYSLANYCKLFNVEFEGEAHDPKYDALNLAYLYDAFLDSKDLVLDEYLKVLQKISHLPEPIRKSVIKLANGEDVTGHEFRDYAREYIK